MTFMLISCRSTLSQMLTSQFLVFPWMRGVSENHSLALFLPYSCLMNLSVFLFLHHSRASDFGLLKIDKSGQIVQFSEKPKGDHLKAMVSNQFLLSINRSLRSLTQLIFLLGNFRKLTLQFLGYHQKKLRNSHT